MSKGFFPRDASPSGAELLPPDELDVIDYIGRYVIVQGRYGPVALDEDNQEPADWSVYRSVTPPVGTILHCKHSLVPGMLYCCDDRSGEGFCLPCMADELAELLMEEES